MIYETNQRRENKVFARRNKKASRKRLNHKGLFIVK